MKSPAFRFYPSDFWASPDVQAMDLHEVGAYLALMSSAWLSERPGCLPDEEERLRRWSRMSREQWQESRLLLLSKFPVIEPGLRANPRLFYEAQKQQAYLAAQSSNGRKGGRPKATDKPSLSETKPSLLSGLSQKKPSVSVSASVSASVSKAVSNAKTKALSPTAPPSSEDPFVAAWNINCGALPKISKLTTARAKKLSVRCREGLSVERFTEAVQLANRTPFLRGDNDRKWKCSFDFLMKSEENILKVIEQAYGEPDKPKQTWTDVTDTPEAADWLKGGR